MSTYALYGRLLWNLPVEGVLLCVLLPFMDAVLAVILGVTENKSATRKAMNCSSMVRFLALIITNHCDKSSNYHNFNQSPRGWMSLSSMNKNPIIMHFMGKEETRTL